MVAYKDLILDPVFECDRLLYARTIGRQAVVLRHADGTPVREFHGQWRPVALYNGLGCMYFLALEQNGAKASWILAPDGRRLGDKLADLAPEQRQRLREAAVAHGLGALDGLVGSGIQFIEPTLLRDVLALAGEPLEQGAAAASAAPPLPSPTPLAMLQAPHGLETHLHCHSSDSGLELRQGWSRDSAGIARAVDRTSVVLTDIVPAASRYLLSLHLQPLASAPSRYVEEIAVTVNNRPLATLRLDAQWQAEGADFAIWLPPEEIGHTRLEIAFHHQRDFVLVGLRLELGRVVPAAELEPADLMLCFENIGDNCEFGLVQRHYGAEPVGLLRFAGLRDPRRLVRFLADDFGNLGDPGSLGTAVIGGEYWIIDHVYGLAYHTFRYQNEVAADEVIRENEVKATYLKRKFREDLEDGEKILVYKRVVTQDPHEMLALHAALNRFGSVNRLFWVTQADAQHAPGQVEWVGNRLLKGYLGRISLEDAHDFDPVIWLRLCRNALAAFQAAGPG